MSSMPFFVISACNYDRRSCKAGRSDGNELIKESLCEIRHDMSSKPKLAWQHGCLVRVPGTACTGTLTSDVTDKKIFVQIDL